MQTIWFKRKTYGWGWTPVTWQGWSVLGLYLVLVLLLALAIPHEPQEEVWLFFVLPAAILTAALLRICYKTGEVPKWQWGEPKDSQKNN